MPKSKAGAKTAKVLNAAGKARTAGGVVVTTRTPRSDRGLLRQAGSIAAELMRKLG